MSNNIHSPNFNVSFSKFKRFTGENATLSSQRSAIPEIINLEKKFLKNLADISKDSDAIKKSGITVSIDADSSNVANVRKLKCIYPNTPSPPQKSITGYQLNLSVNTKCVNDPPENYSSTYHEECLKFCVDVPQSMSLTPVKRYQCANIPPATTPFFIPFGGWGENLMIMNDKKNLINTEMSESDLPMIFKSLGELQTKEVKVRDLSGHPLYIANKNSKTNSLENWTKLEDLCQ